MNNHTGSSSRPSLSAGVLGRILDAVGPASGAQVMGLAITSIALSLAGQETLSRVTLIVAALIWVALAISLVLRARRNSAQFRADIHTPAALTAEVSTAVLGVRVTLLGWGSVGTVALVVAVSLWTALLWPVLRAIKGPTVGGSLLVAVSAEAVAVLAVTVAASEHARWLVLAALFPFVLGLALYAFVLRRFDVHQLRTGRGDHWITGGALAIAALAAAKLAAAAAALGSLGGAGDLRDIAVGLWALAMAWLVVLITAEVRWPRFGYDPRRWSTVFPLGMYAASSFAVGAVTGTSAITAFAQVWVWVAFAFAAIILAATLSRGLATLRAPESRDRARRMSRGPVGYSVR